LSILKEEGTVEESLKNVFKKFDDDVLKLYTPEMKFETTKFNSLGSTCTLVYFCKEELSLYCANIGDSRCVLVSKTKVVRISYDHKPNDDHENKRIKENGGVIFGGRLFGQFNLTRAFGDAAFKKWVISDPYIHKVKLSEKDKYIILASDGIWDVITDEECISICNDLNDSKEICDELVNMAINRWSKDNISCIVIRLN
jgi:protein phosphatase PTC1